MASNKTDRSDEIVRLARQLDHNVHAKRGFLRRPGKVKPQSAGQASAKPDLAYHYSTARSTKGS